MEHRQLSRAAIIAPMAPLRVKDRGRVVRNKSPIREIVHDPLHYISPVKFDDVYFIYSKFPYREIYRALRQQDALCTSDRFKIGSVFVE
jgi:hypothetical protein